MTAVFLVSVIVNAALLIALFYKRIGTTFMGAMQEDDGHADRPEFRRFIARRYRDITGVSGPGVPAEGVMFSDGWVVTHWLDQAPMYEPKTETWHNPGVQPFEKISGHGGATKVQWLD